MPRSKDFRTYGEVVKFGRRLVDWTEVFTVESRKVVDGVADYVKEATLDLSPVGTAIGRSRLSTRRPR